MASLAPDEVTASQGYELVLTGTGSAILDRLVRGDFEDAALFHLRYQAAQLSLAKGFDQLLCLGAVRFEPFPYQVETAQVVLRRFRGRALLCDEVGLGKTIEAGLVLKEYLLRGLVRKVLVLTPPALVAQWQEEMDSKFKIPFVTHEDPTFEKRGTRAWGHFERVIASWHTARTGENAKAILGQRYDMVIVDEAHHFKSRSTTTWQFINQLDKKFILLLTATPVQNNLEELFNLITLLKPGQLKTSRAFKKDFVVRGSRRLPKNRARLQELLFDVMVRNTRSQVGTRLPRRHATTIKVTLSPGEREVYDAVSDFVRREHPRAGHGQRGLNRFILQTLQMEMGSSSFAVAPTLETMAANPHNSPEQRQELARLAAMARSVKDSAKTTGLLKLLRASREKTLVFTKYRETLDHLAASLEREGIQHIVYHGGMSAAAKDEAIARFEREGQVLLCTEAAGEGRNLQFCNTMVNYDLPWNPMRIEQRVGRIHRIGQPREVYIFNLSAEDTVEDYILWLLDAKINMFELVIGEMGMILGHLADERDFPEIITDLWVRARSPEEMRQEAERLGEEMVKAKAAHQRTQELDDTVFGQDYRTVD